uniref:Remorin n=1 Tax=Elaeis guineensis var. tenera TaxID=51953 RepID=A0A8N4EVD2_ELAGV
GGGGAALDEAPPPRPEDKPDDPETVAVVEKVAGSPPPKESSAGSVDRDAVLERVATEKRMSLIKAWEESEKTRAENKSSEEDVIYCFLGEHKKGRSGS